MDTLFSWVHFRPNPPHQKSPFVTMMFLWTPCPYFFSFFNSHLRYLMSYRLFFCMQTSRFQNFTLVQCFIHFLIHNLIFFKIGIHVSSPSFLIHLALQTSNHHPIHIVLQILDFLHFLVYFLFESLLPLSLIPPLSFVSKKNKIKIFCFLAFLSCQNGEFNAFFGFLKWKSQ